MIVQNHKICYFLDSFRIHLAYFKDGKGFWSFKLCKMNRNFSKFSFQNGAKNFVELLLNFNNLSDDTFQKNLIHYRRKNANVHSYCNHLFTISNINSKNLKTFSTLCLLLLSEFTQMNHQKCSVPNFEFVWWSHPACAFDSWFHCVFCHTLLTFLKLQSDFRYILERFQ